MKRYDHHWDRLESDKRNGWKTLRERHGSVAQLAEHSVLNREVVGSTPTRPTKSNAQRCARSSGASRKEESRGPRDDGRGRARLLPDRLGKADGPDGSKGTLLAEIKMDGCPVRSGVRAESRIVLGRAPSTNAPVA